MITKERIIMYNLLIFICFKNLILLAVVVLQGVLKVYYSTKQGK